MKSTLRVPILFVLAAGLTLITGIGVANARSVESMSTGVGVDERVAHKQYSLLMIFAEANGSYLANVTVEIKDAKGDVVLATKSTGPWLFAKLSAGDYKVVATRGTGETTGAAFTIGETGQHVVRLTW